MDLMRQTVDDCPESFLTFMKTIGSYNTGFNCGITYDDYKGGYW